MKGKEGHCVANFATFLPKILLYTSIKSENGFHKVVIKLSAGVLREAGTRVLAPVCSEYSTCLRSNEVSSTYRQIQNQKLD